MKVCNKDSNLKGQPQARSMWSSQDIFCKLQQLSPDFEPLPPLVFKRNILYKNKIADYSCSKCIMGLAVWNYSGGICLNILLHLFSYCSILLSKKCPLWTSCKISYVHQKACKITKSINLSSIIISTVPARPAQWQQQNTILPNTCIFPTRILMPLAQRIEYKL